MSLELKEKEVKYREYFVDILGSSGNLSVSYETDNPFVIIRNNIKDPCVVCHRDNLEEFIKGLILLQKKIKKVNNGSCKD